MGVSPRSLQRKLKQLGSSYSELIETTRFEMATDILRGPDIPLIDIAMMFGYENQSNFGRSFRRVAGMRTPSAEAAQSDEAALVAHLKLQIEKLRRELYGSRSERKAGLLEQMELQLEDLETTAS